MGDIRVHAHFICLGKHTQSLNQITQTLTPSNEEMSAIALMIYQVHLKFSLGADFTEVQNKHIPY